MAGSLSTTEPDGYLRHTWLNRPLFEEPSTKLNHFDGITTIFSGSSSPSAITRIFLAAQLISVLVC